MRRLSVMVIGLGLLGAACGPGRAASLGPAPSGPTPSSPQNSPTPKRSPSPHRSSPSSSPSTPQAFTYEVWFASGGRLLVTKRTSEFSPGVLAIALNALLGGPSLFERHQGAGTVGTAIPSGARLVGVTINSGVAEVNLSSNFFTPATGPVAQLRRAQVVFTATQFATVQSVAFQSNGVPVVVSGPQTRAGYEGELPAIVVESPSIGARVSSPVTVSGTADVFEATVSLRILDQSGHQIAATFTNATCGTGCRGAYSVDVSYSVPAEQPGIIEVYEVSARDGSPINVVRIPVILTP